MDKNTVYILQKDLPFAKAGAEFIRENEDADYYNTNFANYHDRIHKSRVINNIDWFKPKEEPQWEILAYVVNNGVRCTLRSNGKYLNEEFESNNNWGGTLEDVLKYIEKGEGFIESVKRFPDNTVWSVDMVTNNGRITGFHIEKGIMVAEFENNTRHCDLMLLIKAPKETPKPEWEIDSFYHVDYGVMFKDAQNHYQHVSNCGRGWCISLDEALKNTKNMSIHTVKRLSDGEVFSVGDSLDWMGKIESIEIDDRFNGGIAFINNSQKSCISTAKKAPKEEQVPIKVEIMEFGYGKPQENKGKFYVANFNLPNNAKLPTEKYQSIKSAIEDVLNGKQEKIDNYISLKKVVKDFLDEKFPKLYTESELLQACRDAFSSGYTRGWHNGCFEEDKTLSKKITDKKFEDYINSLK